MRSARHAHDRPVCCLGEFRYRSALGEVASAPLLQPFTVRARSHLDLRAANYGGRSTPQCTVTLRPTHHCRRVDTDRTGLPARPPRPLLPQSIA